MRQSKVGAKNETERLAQLETRLGEEIDALVELMRSTRLRLDEGQKFSEITDYLEKFSRACTRLAALLREQRAAASSRDSASELSAVLNEIHAEINRRKEA